MIAMRIMLPEGEDKFREYIRQVRNNCPVTQPNLNSEPYSKEFSPLIQIEEGKTFATKLELAEYLFDCFQKAGITREKVLEKENKGLWIWLAYVWFDQLTNNRTHILKREEHYICTDPSNYRRYYIHLVAPPYNIYSLFNGSPISMLFLYNPVWEINDFTERVAANQFLISHKNVIEAIYNLYFNKEKNRPKIGATSIKVKGNVRRFIKVFQQLELTYDIYSMTPEEIISLLPEEFNEWKT